MAAAFLFLCRYRQMHRYNREPGGKRAIATPFGEPHIRLYKRLLRYLLSHIGGMADAQCLRVDDARIPAYYPLVALGAPMPEYFFDDFSIFHPLLPLL